MPVFMSHPAPFFENMCLNSKTLSVLSEGVKFQHNSTSRFRARVWDLGFWVKMRD